MPMRYVQLCVDYLPSILPLNPKRPAMLTSLLIAVGVGYSATRYALQRIRGSPWIRTRTRQTGPRRVMSR